MHSCNYLSELWNKKEDNSRIVLHIGDFSLGSENKKESFPIVTSLVPVCHRILTLSLPQSTDVKAVYSMRQVLEQIDMEDESSAALRNLLERCIITPCYLKSDTVSFAHLQSV